MLLFDNAGRYPDKITIAVEDQIFAGYHSLISGRVIEHGQLLGICD
jgi:hypothetical protein